MTPYDEHLQILLYDRCKDDDYDPSKSFGITERNPIVQHDCTVYENIAEAREKQKKERLR